MIGESGIAYDQYGSAADEFGPIGSHRPQDSLADKAASIKAVALKAHQDAYSGVPVVVYEGAVGDVLQRVLNVDGEPNGGVCGQNLSTARTGEVGYLRGVEEAQRALNIPITNTSELNAVLSSRPDLIQAIGRGLGVVAARESAHSFLKLCCTMHSDPVSDPAARAAYNASSCNGETDPSPWLGYWPATPRIYLHWQPPALTALSQCLRKGYSPGRRFSCHKP